MDVFGISKAVAAAFIFAGRGYMVSTVSSEKIGRKPITVCGGPFAIDPSKV